MTSLPKPVDCGHGGGQSGGCSWRSWGGAAGAWQAVADGCGNWSAGHGLVI
jgi:hypothetical protein